MRIVGALLVAALAPGCLWFECETTSWDATWKVNGLFVKAEATNATSPYGASTMHVVGMPVRGGPYAERWGVAAGGLVAWNYSVQGISIEPRDGEMQGSYFHVQGDQVRIGDKPFNLRFHASTPSGAAPEAVRGTFVHLASAVANETQGNITEWAQRFLDSRREEEGKPFGGGASDIYGVEVSANLRIAAFLNNLDAQGIEEDQRWVSSIDLKSGNTTVFVSLATRRFNATFDWGREILEVDRNDFASYHVTNPAVTNPLEAYASLAAMLERHGLPVPERTDVTIADVC